MSEKEAFENDDWYETWKLARIRDRTKRYKKLGTRLNEPPHRIEVEHLKRWMAFVKCKTLTELVQLRKQHLEGQWESTQLREFVKKLGEEGKAVSVAGRATSTIRGFYRDVGLPLREFHRAKV